MHSPHSPAGKTVELGDFLLDLERGELRARDGRLATLRRQSLLVLLELTRNAGHVVNKEDLIELIWPGVAVTEDSLVQAVADIRRLLGHDASRRLKTVHRRGYLLEMSIKQSSLLPNKQLIGRTAELVQLKELLTIHRLVTLTGPGGIGKTSLAQAVMETLPNAVSVDLSTLQDSGLVDGRVAAAFGLSLAAGPQFRKQLIAALAHHRGLLFLDNCEHLQQVCATLLQALADEAPGLQLLATSRSPLRINCEQIFQVQGLACPPMELAAAEAAGFDAVVLFFERAQSSNYRFKVDAATTQATVEICRAVDGMPLAIEMAAAAVATFGLTELAQLLAQDRPVLEGGNRLLPERQRSLAALYGWSYRLLDECARAIYRKLSVFPGAFDLAAAERVVAAQGVPVGRVLQGLASLVEHSLLAPLHGSPARWRLHPTARESAKALMDAAGESAAVQDQHLAFLVETYESLFGSWFVMSDADWRDQTDPLQADLRVALSWATGAGMNAASAAALMGASLPDWQWRDFQSYYEGARWCLAVNNMPACVLTPGRQARWLYVQSVLMPTNVQARCNKLQEAENAAEQSGEMQMQVLVQLDLAEHAQLNGRIELALSILNKITEDHSGLTSKRLLGTQHFYAGQVARVADQYERAYGCYLAARRSLTNAGAECLALHATLHLGQSLWDLHRLNDALECLRSVASESMFSRFGDDHVTGFALLFAAGVCTELGQLDAAAQACSSALAPLGRTGYGVAGLPILSAGLALIGKTQDAKQFVDWQVAHSENQSVSWGSGTARILTLRDAAIANDDACAGLSPFGVVSLRQEDQLSRAKAIFDQFLAKGIAPETLEIEKLQNPQLTLPRR
jgi:predicted ATPase/DNA-binding winged helix-turn-helix (wHTH) protein/tetratricopeptide (TPR) repeat protein